MLAIYTRLSREDAESSSIKNQIRTGKIFARENGFQEFEIYNEGEGISGGAKLSQRPELQRLLFDMESEKITTVWFRDQNRLERSGLTLHTFVESAIEYEVDVYFNDKLEDFQDTDSQFMTTMRSAMNVKTNRDQSKHTKRQLHINMSEGKHRGGIFSYGYGMDSSRNTVILEEEAKIVRRIYKMSLEGKGMDKIATILNEEGVQTRYNRIGTGTIKFKHKDTAKITERRKVDINWAGNTIRGILNSEKYKGIAYLGKKKERRSYDYPIIIEPEMWQKVQDNIPKNRNNSGKENAYNYLLKGILRCGKCGRNYYGKITPPRAGTSTHKDYRYICSSTRKGQDTCGNRGVNITRIETFIIKHLFEDRELHEVLRKTVAENVTIKNLEAQLETESFTLKRLLEEEDILYLRLKDIRLKDDERLIKDYDNTKGRRKASQSRFNRLKSQINDEKQVDKLKELNETIADFNIESNFEIIREQVESMLDEVEVFYVDNEKKQTEGSYIFILKFKQLGVKNVIYSNFFLKEFIWTATHRLKANNEIELQSDIDLTVELSGKDPRTVEMENQYGKFNGLESLESRHGMITIFESKDFIKFN